MTDYYIASTGNDANDGLTLATAWANPSRATGQNAGGGPASGIGPGDTCYILNGTYISTSTAVSSTTPAYNPTNSGTANRPIAFRAYTGSTGRHAPVLDRTISRTGGSTDGEKNPVFGSAGLNYIIWDGMTTVADERVGKCAVLLNATGCIIENCTISPGNRQSTGNPSAGNYYCIYLQNAPLTILRYNTLSNSYTGAEAGDINAGGIAQFDSRGILVHNNTIDECSDCCNDKRGGQDNVWELNDIRPTNSGRGIQMTSFSNAGCSAWDCGVKRVTWRNNLIRGGTGSIAININVDGASTSTQNNGGYALYNNTFYNFDRGMRVTYNIPGVKFYNNILSLTGAGSNRAQQWGAAPSIFVSTDLVSDFNCYQQLSGTLTFEVSESGGRTETFATWQSAASTAHSGRAFDANGFAGAPGFVGPTLSTSVSSTAFTLATTSTCLAAGRTGGSTDGVARNMGCFAVGNEVIGVPTTRLKPLIGSRT